MFEGHQLTNSASLLTFSFGVFLLWVPRPRPTVALTLILDLDPLCTV